MTNCKYLVLSITQDGYTTMMSDTANGRGFTFWEDSMITVIWPIRHSKHQLRITDLPSGGYDIQLSPDPAKLSGRFRFVAPSTLIGAGVRIELQESNLDVESVAMAICPKAGDFCMPNLEDCRSLLMEMKSQGVPEWQIAMEASRQVHAVGVYGDSEYQTYMQDLQLPWDSLVLRNSRGEVSNCGGFNYILGMLVEQVLDSTTFAILSMGDIVDDPKYDGGHAMGMLVVPRDTGALWIIVDPIVGASLRRADGEPLDYRAYLQQILGSRQPDLGQMRMEPYGIDATFRQKTLCLNGPFLSSGATTYHFLPHDRAPSWLVLARRGHVHFFEGMERELEKMYAANSAYWGFARAGIAWPQDSLWLPTLYRGTVQVFGAAWFTTQQLDASIRAQIVQATARAQAASRRGLGKKRKPMPLQISL